MCPPELISGICWCGFRPSTTFRWLFCNAQVSRTGDNDVAAGISEGRSALYESSSKSCEVWSSKRWANGHQFRGKGLRILFDTSRGAARANRSGIDSLESSGCFSEMRRGRGCCQCSSGSAVHACPRASMWLADFEERGYELPLAGNKNSCQSHEVYY